MGKRGRARISRAILFIDLLKGDALMARCEICDKGPMYGHRVSHAHNLTKRRWNPNLQRVRAVVGKTHKSLRVCTNCIRSGRVTKA
jgi:large subunit ribosomal protein L28